MTIYRNKPTPETRHRMEVLQRKRKPLRKISENLWVLDFPFYLVGQRTARRGSV